MGQPEASSDVPQVALRVNIELLPFGTYRFSEPLDVHPEVVATVPVNPVLMPMTTVADHIVTPPPPFVMGY